MRHGGREIDRMRWIDRERDRKRYSICGTERWLDGEMEGEIVKEGKLAMEGELLRKWRD